MITFSPFPVIETKNLSLRRMTNDDTYDIFELRKDPRMNEYTDTRLDESPEETKSYINKMNKGIDEGKSIVWAIEHRQLKKVIGSISIWNINLEQRSAELGYGITPGYQNKGLMKEALLSVVDYGFNVMNLSALEAYTEEKNIKSIKLLEGCKFIEVNRVDDEGCYSDRIYHMVIYRLEKFNK
jgi:[ribosomal protein S5]-alanine N-acetyltransferase